MAYAIRPYKAGDAETLATVFEAAVRVVGAHGYNEAQVAAWLGRSPAAADKLRQRVDAGHWIVVAADQSDRPVAYAMLEQDGHLDHLYCHPDHTRKGLADRLLMAAEAHARDRTLARLYTEASELARPAFERAGYVVTQRRDFTIEHDGEEVPIHNYAMEKALS